jgi:hypothetical protein
MKGIEHPEFKTLRTDVPVISANMTEEQIQEVNDFIDNLW